MEMAPLHKLFTVAITLASLSTKIDANGSSESYPNRTSIELTKEMMDSSIFIAESSPKNGRGFDYPCESLNNKTCLLLCCVPEMALLEESCTDDNAPSWSLPRIKTSVANGDVKEDIPRQEYHLMTYDPCAVNWMTSSVLKDFEVLQNGSIYAPNFDGRSVFDFEHHCLFRKPESKVFLAKVCHPWIIKVRWQIYCSIFVILVMLGILITYSVVPELKNLHGMVFRSYIAAYIGTHISILGQQFTADSRNNAYLFTLFVFSLHYCSGCCALWLNVMCFNIWRTFRRLQLIDSDKRGEKKKFIQYGVYAYVTPAVFNITTALIMFNVSYFDKFALNKNLILWNCAVLLTTVFICNTLLYSLTALKIRKHKKDTAYLTDGVNKHNEVEIHWFNLHVKLFIIMGPHTMMWVICELWPIPSIVAVSTLIEVVQTLMVFFILIWKDNIKRSLYQQFNDKLHRVGSYF